MLCTFLVFYFCAASHGLIKNDKCSDWVLTVCDINYRRFWTPVTQWLGIRHCSPWTSSLYGWGRGTIPPHLFAPASDCWFARESTAAIGGCSLSLQTHCDPRIASPWLLFCRPHSISSVHTMRWTWWYMYLKHGVREQIVSRHLVACSGLRQQRDSWIPNLIFEV